MVRLKIRLRPGTLRRLEASIRGGAKAVSNQLFQVITAESNKWAQSLIKAIESDSRFSELKSDDDLRGQLGMARTQFKKGGDTDAEDLITLLRGYSVKSSTTGRSKKLNIKFPSLSILEQRLVRSLSSISDKGAVSSGPLQSWFRWWEFGDQGEITSLTVLRRTIGKLKQAQGRGQSKSRSALAKLISRKSRSGTALQITSLPADGTSHISGRGLISDKYRKFAKIFPARLGKKVKAYQRNNRTRIQKLFAQARTT